MLWAAEAVTHCRKAHVKCQAHHELTVRYVAAALDNVLGLNLKGCWIVNLFEVSSEEALMVVLPFDKAGDLISELRIRYVTTSLIHRSLIAAFHGWNFLIIPQTASLVASLMLNLTSNDVKN